MNRHGVAVSLFLALLIVSLCGCQKGGQPVVSALEIFTEPQYEWGTSTGRNLTVWGRETDLDRNYMRRAFQRYEEFTGNTVTCVAFSPEELELYGAAAFNGETEGPDLLLSFGGVNIDAFNPDENFYDFSDAVWVDDLTEVSINQTIYHGKVIGLPHWEASISGTIYNKEIFERFHLTQPRTQEEFLTVCEVLLKNGVTPLYLPGASPTMLLYQFPLDVLLEKGDTLERLNRGDLGYCDLPEMETVVEWYRTMAERGYLGQDYLQNDWDGMSHALDSGAYAMMLCWDTWLYTDFKGDPAQFGLMPAFLGVPETGTFEGPNLSLLMVNRHSEQVDAAVELVTFLADPYNYNAAFEGTYTAPVFKQQVAGISTPQYVEAERWIENNYRDSTAWLRICGFSQSDATCILDYMCGREDYTAEDCLKDMDRLRLERLLKENQLGERDD